MIIRFPTGFYRNVLPSNDESGNVTYTISMSPPPRANLVFPKTPLGIVNKRRDLDMSTPQTRRTALGELVFSISTASRTTLGNTARQYDLGDVLEFGSGDQGTAVAPMLVGTKSETRHGTNQIDYTSVGLSQDDHDLVQTGLLTAFTDLTARLNLAKSARVNAEIELNTVQKQLNETVKVLNAVKVADSVAGGMSDILAKLEHKRAAFEQRKTQLVAEANRQAAKAAELAASLRETARLLE